MGVVLVDEYGNPLGGNVAIFPENQQAVDLFVACSRQWDICPQTNQPLRLNYPGLAVSADFLQIPKTPELLEQIQYLEAAALGLEIDFPDLDKLHIIRVELDSDGEQL